MIIGAGVMTDEARAALERVRAQGQVRTHKTPDDAEPAKRERRFKRNGATYRIRQVLAKGPAAGMTVREIRAVVDVGLRTVRLLQAMSDVIVDTSAGRFNYRYRLKA
jgi:hypothetical protein